MSIYHILVTISFQNPRYLFYYKLKKQQFHPSQKIYFLINGLLPEGFILDPKTDLYFPEFPIEEKLMQWKFYKALLQLYSDPLQIPPFVLRVNASTLISLEKINGLLESLPKTHLLAGHVFPSFKRNPGGYVSGTCMIFSKDVIHHLLQVPEKLHAQYQPDDILLSNLCKIYVGSLFPLNRYFLWLENRKWSEYDDSLWPGSVFVRIKTGDANYDLSLTQRLMNLH